MSESLMNRPHTEQQTLPLVAAQPGIWIADQLSRHHNAYAVAHFIELHGDIDSTLLSKAIIAGMQEADTLNMAFGEVDGEALQWPQAQSFTPPQVVDLRSDAHPADKARALMREDMNGDLRVLSGAPLYHHCLYRLGEQHWFWYQRYHHLVVDGFSFTALTRRIANLYSAWARQQEPEPTPFIPFSEVVEEYQRYQQSSSFERDRQFWREKGASLPAPASLAPQPLAGQSASTQLLRHSLTLDRATFQTLVSQHPQHSAADLAFALVGLWLARLSGQNDFSAGFIFMRRIGSAALCATGPVINVLPMAIHYDPDQPLAALATQLAGEVKKMRRHQRYDAEQVQRDLGRLGDGDPIYGPVINLKMFDYQLDFAGVEGITHQLASGPVRDLEIAIYISEQGDLTLELLANAERYNLATLQRHTSRFALLLTQLAAAPQRPCGELDLLTTAEHQWLAEINHTPHPLPAETLASLLAQQVARTPDAPALADAQHQLSYRQMQQQVFALAQQLSAAGVAQGDIVAVALPRSVQLSLALQAIVSLGAAYLPLDTGYPDDRLQLMLEDATPQTLITSASLAPRFAAISDVSQLHFDALFSHTDAPAPRSAPQPQDGAYIIYTSGSTGRPKGVLVGHEAIVNRLLWMQNHYPLQADDVVLQKTPSSFDVSVWEFFWPLLVGAQLVMAPPEAHRDPEALQQLFAQHRVTTTHFVPSMLAAFVAALQDDTAISHCASLRRVFCSGEALPTDLSREWEQLTRVPLHNLYGPTEAAVDVSWYPAFGESLAAVEGASVPIGYPVWNTGLRILDARLQPVPPGVAGDLYLTGIQLAHGYLGRPDLTASRFVADPAGNGERMYRTGDVARWLDNGAVEYLGRSDDQLKIRGQRIELNEIDHVLCEQPGIEQAVTHAVVLGGEAAQGDARQLVGYVIADHAVDGEALRNALAQQLPAHMVPVAIVQLETFPLSSNGKLDRKALPLPQATTASAGREPHPGLESQLAAAFCQLLARDSISAQDDFFALGGHSLLAMRLAAQLRRELQQPVSVGQIMVASTVEKLAALLSDEQSHQQAGFEAVLPLRQGSGPNLFCFHPASGFAWQFSILQRYLEARWSLIGIQSPDTTSPLNHSLHLDEVCEAHLRTLREVQPHGPYYFLGYSLGGTLAQGIAARLAASGEEVAFLGLLDTWPPETQNWDEKRGENVLDPAVLDEVNREREQFIAAQRHQAGEEMQAMFDTIEANYASSVRLLATARSARFSGRATLFLAQQTQQPGQDARRAWAPYVSELEVWPMDCAHVDIISPKMFEQIGPLLQRLLSEL
ncbi:enterobactin synthase subunit F [Pantoea sp. At-9b]|uniref:enterobactin synthase subunit F n=1 Tax=Pantoea sp. (strain At-9b) TaxID=592316 RepID=UPI0001B3F844|nr:enterobactin synthase subunit F [Pantoea sp. At-9b]ADU67817.1 amino acid adenylation domain protein [Pantoea sp. At-9b]